MQTNGVEGLKGPRHTCLGQENAKAPIFQKFLLSSSAFNAMNGVVLLHFFSLMYSLLNEQTWMVSGQSLLNRSSI